MNALLVLLTTLLVLTTSAQANDQEAHYQASGEMGVRYHTGSKGKSFTGAIGPFLYFQAESRRGVFCPNLGVAMEFISGQATVSSGSVSGTAYSGGIYPGVDIYPLRRAKYQPFVELHGVASWNYAALAPIVPKTQEKSIGLAFGFQVGGGLDIKYHSGQRAYRVHLSYSSYSTTLAGQSGFQLNALSASLGLSF
jgi:hypothetical protein